MPRASLAPLAVLAALWCVRPAAADDAATARAILERIESGQGDRAAAQAELEAVAPRAVEAIGGFLGRPHAASVEDRRTVLQGIHAAVPNKNGRFSTPGRQKADKVQADDEFDWLAELAKVEQPLPGHGEVVADVAAIRALAASRQVDAARVVLDTAFADDTMIYRDECGRRLRAMDPYSLPALTVASQAKNKAMARYANYQLERLDRQETGKAMAATATDEDLRIALVRAFGESHHREAVGTVMDYVDDAAPRVRAAAREAWMAYLTGPPPPPAPKKRLQLPGGKLADKPTPLWLTWRELATIELQRTAEEVLGKVFEDDQEIDAVALSNELFAHYDGERRTRDDVAFARAQELADGGDLAGAATAFDRLLARDPNLPQRAQAAPIYLALAHQHEKAKQWDEAAAAFGKAYGVDPDGPAGIDAQAGREYALGKSLEAAGKDGGPNFRRAIALKPDYAPARAAAGQPMGTRKPWLLWTGVAGGGLALAFLVLGLARRRARA